MKAPPMASSSMSQQLLNYGTDVDSFPNRRTVFSPEFTATFMFFNFFEFIFFNVSVKRSREPAYQYEMTVGCSTRLSTPPRDGAM
jgi:hypothetical protein